MCVFTTTKGKRLDPPAEFQPWMQKHKDFPLCHLYICKKSPNYWCVQMMSTNKKDDRGRICFPRFALLEMKLKAKTQHSVFLDGRTSILCVYQGLTCFFFCNLVETELSLVKQQFLCDGGLSYLFPLLSIINFSLVE